MKQLWQMYMLQQVDRKVAVVEGQLAGLVMPEDLPRKVTIREQKVKDATEKLRQDKTKLKESEHKLASLETHIADIEKKLYQNTTTNTKELAGFSAEAAQLKAQKSKIEDAVLALMEQVEADEAEVNNQKARLERGRQAVADHTQKMEVSRVQLEQQLESLKTRRAGVAAEIENVFLSRYEGLRKRKQGIAVARLVGSACGECGVNLPEPVCRRVHQRELELCSNCERILFFAEEKAAAPSA